MTADPIPRRARTLLLVILAGGLLLRLLHWWWVRDQPFWSTLVVDSREYDRWAREIAGGDWLGSAVFFQAPCYPYLLAGIYTLFGHRLDAVYLLQAVAAVAGCWALWAASRRLAGERAGLVAAALAAGYGPFVFYDIQVQKESFAVAVVCLLLLVGIHAREEDRRRHWIAFGALLGALCLLRENALLVAPLLLVVAVRRGDGWRQPARRAAAFTAGLVLVLLPVALRNYAVGGQFLPTTFQGGVNLYIGNHAGADGTYIPLVPGRQTPDLERREAVRLAEAAVGHPLSPAEVSTYWRHRALAWAAAEPGAFARLQLHKLGLFWSWYEWPDAVDYAWAKTLSAPLRWAPFELGGVSLLAALGLLVSRRRLGAYLVPLLFAAGWTASVIAFFLFSRYRLPVVPALILVAAPALAEASRRWPSRRGVALLAGCVLCLGLPRLVSFPPRLDLVHVNLAHLAEEAGDAQEAAVHYQQALDANPEDLGALLGLGTAAARSGDLATAEQLVTRATLSAPDSVEAAADLGALYLAAGRLPAAEAAITRALDLDPANPVALQNGVLLRLRQANLAAARGLLDRLLVVDPSSPAAARLQQRLAAEERRQSPPDGESAPPGAGRR